MSLEKSKKNDMGNMRTKTCVAKFLLPNDDGGQSGVEKGFE